MAMKGKLQAGGVFISSELIAAVMAAHHLTGRHRLHETPDWTSWGPSCF